MLTVGVVVGRFQTNDLHLGQVSLLNHANGKNDQLVVFLLVPRSGLSSVNPIDYHSRQLLIQEYVPNAVVLPLVMQKTGEELSLSIDQTIHKLFPDSKVTLYAGRDSDIFFYNGDFSQELAPWVSSVGPNTQTRSLHKKKCISSEDFRSGQIYAVSRLPQRPLVCTDTAVLYQSSERDLYVLLGKKDDDTLWRFPGGKVDKDDSSLEYAARREVREETNIYVPDLKYIASTFVDDWRYRDNPETKIITTFFVGKIKEQDKDKIKAGDDLAKVQWHSLNTLEEKDMVDNHVLLLTFLSSWLKKTEAKEWTDEEVIVPSTA